MAIIGAVLTCAAGGVGALALSASGEVPRPALPERTAAFTDRPQTELPLLPSKRKPRVVEPVAGAAGAASAQALERPVEQASPLKAPKPRRSASRAGDLVLARPTTAGDGVDQATALPNGIALPPLEAPEAVRRMIEAGNQIARTPYLWGGGTASGSTRATTAPARSRSCSRPRASWNRRSRPDR